MDYDFCPICGCIIENEKEGIRCPICGRLVCESCANVISVCKDCEDKILNQEE